MVGNVFGFLFVWLKRGEGCTLQCVSMNVQCVSMNVLLLQQCGSLSGLWPEFQRKTCAETFWGSSLGHPLRCCQSHHLVGMVRYCVVSEHMLAWTVLLSITPLGQKTGMYCVIVSHHFVRILACTVLLSVSQLSQNIGMHCIIVCLTT